MNKPTTTNLEQLDALSDEMIDTSDIPPLGEEFFATAHWRMPQLPESIANRASACCNGVIAHQPAGRFTTKASQSPETSKRT